LRKFLAVSICLRTDIDGAKTYAICSGFTRETLRKSNDNLA